METSKLQEIIRELEVIQSDLVADANSLTSSISESLHLHSSSIEMTTAIRSLKQVLINDEL